MIHWSIDLKISEQSISFPCDYPIKVLCENRPGLLNEVVDCISKHDLSFKESAVREKMSQKKNYVSVSVILRALSESHIKDLYLDLKKIESVKLVL